MQTLSVTPHTPVTSTPAGIDCPDTCQASFASGTAVTLDAPGGFGTGGCVGSVEPCTLILDAPTTVMTYRLVPAAPSPAPPGYGVNVTVSGPGQVVAGRAIHCSPWGGLNGCTAAFPFGASVVLRALPSRGGRVVRWSGYFCNGKHVLSCRGQVYSDVSGEVVFGRR
jgi:hypothetical protein